MSLVMWLITSSMSLGASAAKLAAWNKFAPLGFLVFLSDNYWHRFTFPCSCSRTLSLKHKRDYHSGTTEHLLIT